MKFPRLPPYITRVIWIVSLVSLFNDIASEMLYPIMPVFLKSIGFSIVLIGVLEGVAEATSGLSKGYFGNLSDRMGARMPFVRIGYMLSAISKPMMALFTMPWYIFVARTTDRLGKGIRTSARDALLSDETTPLYKGRVFGFHRSLDTLGAAIGPLLALIFLALWPGQYNILFIIAFLPGLVAVLLTFAVHEKKPAQASGNKPGFFTFLKYFPAASRPYKFLVVGLLLFTLFNSSDAFLLLALKNSGLSDPEMIGFYIFYNLVFALVAFPVGVVADRIGLFRTMVIGLSFFAMVYVGMGYASSFLHFFIIFSGYGLYASATEGVSKALVTNLSRKGQTATALGFYNSMGSVVTMLASSIAGLLWFNYGPRFMFVFSGVGVTLVIIYFLVFRRVIAAKTV